MLHISMQNGCRAFARSKETEVSILTTAFCVYVLGAGMQSKLNSELSMKNKQKPEGLSVAGSMDMCCQLNGDGALQWLDDLTAHCVLGFDLLSSERKGLHRDSGHLSCPLC